MGSGGRQYRYEHQASAGDVLPTAEIIALAKRAAARVCCDRAVHFAWPDIRQAQAELALIPLVALAALGELIVDVPMARLARCLGLDPLDAPDEISRRKQASDWPVDLTEQVLLAIGGGQ